MSENLGTGVSYVNEAEGYNYDTVVFQKGVPPLDSELNLVQQLKNISDQRQVSFLPSGWLTMRPFYTNSALVNKFYTQNPSGALPEFAMVNGQVIKVTNTGTSESNTNLIDLGTAPTTGNQVNGVYLEMWRSLLAPNSSANKPDPVTVVDTIYDLTAFDANNAWAVGGNGLILNTINGGTVWNVQVSGTKYQLNGVDFVTSLIGWVVGNNGFIANTSSGGSRWTALTNSSTDNLNGVYAFDQLTAWAVGDNGTILKAVNGLTFTPLSSNVTTNLRGVYFVDKLVGWVVGANGTILKTTDGGNNWLAQNSGTANNLNAVNFYDLNFGYIVGDNGTILRTCNGGGTWVSQSSQVYVNNAYTTITSNLYDVKMVPSFDVQVLGEEVTSQFNGTNKNCTVMNVPVTHGDGKGTTTNNPADIIVTVDGVPVVVDSLYGAAGQIVLHNAPRLYQTVKVTYYHKITLGTFNGKAYIVGDLNSLDTSLGTIATILETDDLGAMWNIQNSKTAYPLNAVSFVNLTTGWSAGNFSTIRYTSNGVDWNAQQSEALSRVVQRVFYEGNTGTTTYLEDDSIHPDTNIETTKRVQIQYRIRVAKSVDPANYPDAGLGSQAILSIGPNSTGIYAYTNAGPTTGDYGLYVANCPNTVDGVCWAIPMFFVNRRNSSAFDPTNNMNGTNTASSTFIRPDFLTATQVDGSDILDVRRKCFAPDLQEMLEEGFDSVSKGNLKTQLSRLSVGGDRYGTELLQMDRLGTDGGGTSIGTDPTTAYSGQVTSTVSLIKVTTTPNPLLNTTPYVFTAPAGSTGYYHIDVSQYSAMYVGGPLDGKPIPGAFSGLGTTSVTFTFSANTLVGPTIFYSISATWVSRSATSLTYIPTNPRLVQSLNTGSYSFYYNGVFEGSNKTVEQWNSGITGYQDYAVAKPSILDGSMVNMASTVEVHYFKQLTQSDISTDSKTIKIPALIPVYTTDTAGNNTQVGTYQIFTISKVNNIVSSFSYKIANQLYKDPSLYPTDPDSGKIIITSVDGFPFLPGVIIEVIGEVVSPVSGSSATRNGATVNFLPGQRGIENFCVSRVLSATTINTATNQATFTTVDGSLFEGLSTTETNTSLTQNICWVSTGTGVDFKMYPVTVVSGLGTSSIILQINGSIQWSPSGNQVEAQFTALQITKPANSLVIAYNYTPSLSVTTLPAQVSVEMVTKPSLIYISDLGSGAGSSGYPYINPLEHIPVNDNTITDDAVFNNMSPIVFNNFSVDTGFVQMPIYVPADTGDTFTLSSPTADVMGRSYFSGCSKTMTFTTEGLTKPVIRKIYVAAVIRVMASPDSKFLPGEFLLAILSRDSNTLDNFTGYIPNANSVVAVYRLPNKPMSRI
jgi:photosystem II stability/assembly factor-like uncharacterized protein